MRHSEEDPVRILVLEDEDDFRERLAEVLTEAGHRVETAASALEAIALAEEHVFDLVVADIRMKGMDGLQALENVRATRPNVQSLVITGYSTEADSIRAIRLGVGDYLKKPFRLTDFLHSVERLAAESRRHRRAQAREGGLWATILATSEALLRATGEEDCGPGVGRLAGRLAALLDLPPEDTMMVQVATLLAVLERKTPDALGWEGLFPPLLRLVEEIADGWEGTLERSTLAAQIGGACLLSWGGDPFRGPVEGRFEPTVLEGLRRLQQQEQPAGSAVLAGSGLERRARTLLFLARALLDGGQAEQATRALEKVAVTPPSRESAEALLELARLSAAAGAADRARQFALQAAALRNRLSPAAAAELSLEIGVLLGSLGAPETLPFLRDAEDASTQLGLSRLQGCARLAGLYWSGELPRGKALSDRVEPLLSPDYRAGLSWLGRWLLEILVERLPCPELEPMALRLARELPGELLRLRETANPEVVARLLAQTGAEEGLPEAARAAAPVVRLYTLGTFQVHLGERPVPFRAWQSRNVRYLLAWLAVRMGRGVPTDHIIEQFWPDDAERGRLNLNWAVSVLRKCLSPEGRDPVTRTGTVLGLNTEMPFWHDVGELLRHLREGDQARGTAALDCYRRAVQLYKGPFLDECYMEWAVEIRRELERKVLEAARKLLDGGVEDGRNLEVLEYGERVLRLDPCCQQACLSVMGACLALARPEEAVRHFRMCQEALRRELGMDPGLDLLRLHQRALLNLEPARVE